MASSVGAGSYNIGQGLLGGNSGDPNAANKAKEAAAKQARLTALEAQLRPGVAPVLRAIVV